MSRAADPLLQGPVVATKCSEIHMKCEAFVWAFYIIQKRDILMTFFFLTILG